MPPKSRKNQEALALVINIGVTKYNSQSNSTLLEKVKHVAQRIIEKKIFLRPKDDICVILMGSSVTKNSLNTEHVSEFEDFQIPNWDLIEKIMHLKSTNCCSNWIEALEVTMEFIRQNALSPLRKIVLMSDFNEDEDIISQFEVCSIADSLTAQSIQLITIGEKSLDERPESSLTVSEVFLKELHNKISGQHLTIDNAISDFKFYVKPPSDPGPWYATLELSDIKIDVCSYIKVTDADKFSPWKIGKDGKELKTVTEYIDRQRNTYKPDERIAGYKYGEKFVPVEKQLEEELSYKSGPKCYRIHSFTHRNNIDLEYWCDTTTRVVFPSKKANNAAKTFYSLVQAMHNKNMVAIVRKVYANNRAPRVVALFPCVNIPDEPWCLVEVCTPFAEDRRVMDTRPLKSILKQLSNEQNEALDNLLDTLMLPETEDSCIEEGSQYFLPGHVLSPAVQHRWNVLSYRALNPGKPLPTMEDYLKELLEAPVVKERSKDNLQKIAKLFQLEDIDPKGKKKDESNEKDGTTDNKVGADDSTKDDKGDMFDSFNEPVISMDTMDVDLDDLVANI